jgi:hypothetical protein
MSRSNRGATRIVVQWQAALLALLLAAFLVLMGRTSTASEPPTSDKQQSESAGENAAENLPATLPRGARIRLVSPKERWLLGENILLDYEVKNEGSEPFQVDIGGDYRGGTRADRFKVTAVSVAGEIQDDPAPSQIHMGGLGGSFEVQPGKSWYGTVPLMRYRTLSKAGTYSIRVAHDLGWGGPVVDGMLDPRWADVDIEVVMPTDKQAREVVAEMQRLTDSGGTWGEKREPYPDFSCLRYPVYLPVLMELAKAHHPEAIQGLSGIDTPAGTEALIELLTLVDDAEARKGNIAALKVRGITFWEPDTIADLAARAISERVPIPEKLRAGSGHAWRGEAYFAARDKRVAAGWRPEHAEPVRKYAQEVLLKSKPQGLSDNRKEFAAYLLETIGVAEDHAAIVAGLDHALELSRRESLESPLIYGLIPTLQQCATTLEIAAPAEPKSPGEIAVYLLVQQHSKDPRPEDFAARARGWLHHPIAYVRRLTLEALPRPVPDWAIDELPPLLASGDVGVRLQAATAAAESKAARLGDAVMKQIAVEQDPWVIAALDRAAHAVGEPRDRILEAWAKRLGETMYDPETQRWGTGAKSFEMLRDSVIEYSGGSGWDGNQQGKKSPGLSQRWLAFIAANREELLRGRRFRVGDPELKENLFPLGAHIYHEGKPWPPGE